MLKTYFFILIACSLTVFGAQNIKTVKKNMPIQQKKVFLKQPSIFKEKKDVYKDYISYLINDKMISEREVKETIASNKNTLSKNMLSGIFYDFEVNQPNKASHYYVNILNNGRDYIRGTPDAVYIADYLVRDKVYKVIPDILPKDSCELMTDTYKTKCFYFQAVAYYNLDLSYDIPLSKAIDMEPKAKEFYEAIVKNEEEMKKTGGIKK